MRDGWLLPQGWRMRSRHFDRSFFLEPVSSHLKQIHDADQLVLERAQALEHPPGGLSGTPKRLFTNKI